MYCPGQKTTSKEFQENYDKINWNSKVPKLKAVPERGNHPLSSVKHYKPIVAVIVVFVGMLLMAQPTMAWYSKTNVLSPWGELAVFFPAEVPAGIFSEEKPGTEVWENDQYLAYERKEHDATYYLIMDANIPHIYVLIKIQHDQRQFWQYRHGKPEPISQQTFNDLFQLPTPCHVPAVNAM